MKIILNVNLKGSSFWPKGTEFDNSKEPFPSDIEHLISRKSIDVSIVPEPVVPIVKRAISPEIKETPVEEEKPLEEVPDEKPVPLIKKRETVKPKELKAKKK